MCACVCVLCLCEGVHAELVRVSRKTAVIDSYVVVTATTKKNILPSFLPSFPIVSFGPCMYMCVLIHLILKCTVLS